MKVQIINKQGIAWTFNSVSEARKHLKKRPDCLDIYYEKLIGGEKVRVYDDRDLI